MSIKEWFDQLTKKIKLVEEQWQGAAESDKVTLANELFELRKISDQVIDLWLQYEEKLSHAIKRIKQVEGQLVPTAEIDDQSIHTHLFRKGEGFYHLRLYQDAKQCFENLVKESPDWESGRLYYAYSLLFCDEKEAAMKEFRLLSHSASSPKVVSISFNAIGCILAEEEQWLEAAQAFKTALKEQPSQKEARFNLALCYLHDGEAQDALDTIEEYLQQSPEDWEAQIVWLRTATLLQSNDESVELSTPNQLQIPTFQLEPDTLHEMALLYESAGNYHRAQLCYTILTEQLPDSGWAWHGLAWNTWLIAGTKRSLSLMKKAISLAPTSLDFLFSYGWMLLFDGRVEQAMTAFQFILLQDRDHRLAQSGLITAYERLGDVHAAKTMAKRFTDDNDLFMKSLGYYQLGRIAVIEENWRLAEQYFQRVDQNRGEFHEVSHYVKLCASKIGQNLDSQEAFTLQQ